MNRDGLAHAAVGFGINVNLSAADLPTPAAGSLPPTSLAIALGQQLDREQLLCTILQAIDQTYAQLWAGNHDAIREAWAARLVGYGERVTITTNANTHQGIMRGIDTDGALLLEIAGKTERFLSGDVLIGPRFPQR